MPTKSKVITKRELIRDQAKLIRAGAHDAEPPLGEHWRPKTRGDCVNGPRPCPYVGCQYHLAVGATRSGGIRFELGEHVELEDMAETCALDVADRGGMRLDAIGGLLGMTRERVRQIQVTALAKLRRYCAKHGIAAGDWPSELLGELDAPETEDETDA